MGLLEQLNERIMCVKSLIHRIKFFFFFYYGKAYLYFEVEAVGILKDK